MKAGETTLKPLLEGAKQYQVPIFQRSYIWGGAQLRQIWDDILAQYEVLAPSAASSGASRGSHFMGSFVLSPETPSAHGVSKFLIVDGQQRMTTVLLALAALRDAQKAVSPMASERIQNLYLWNQYATNEDRYKLVPSRLDREAFFRCISGDGVPQPAESRIADAYRFFKLQLSRPLPEDAAPIDFDVMERVLIDRLAVVDITVGGDDNPNRIFESLNATGVDLTQADLLRNFLFMLLPSQAESVYDHVWLPMELDLGPDNLEALARLDLLRRGTDARRDEVYRLQRERIEQQGTDEPSVVTAIKDLALRAQHYARLIEPWRESDPRIATTLTRLKRWGAQTTYPLFMHLYDLVERGAIDTEQMAQASLYVESFIIRRQIGQVPTNQLNRLFTDMIKQLPADKPVAVGIREALSGERRYWLTDDQIRTACREKWFYITGRADQRKLVLECIEESYGHQEPVDLSKAKLTIEHVLPQTLSDGWRHDLIAQGDDPDRLREELLHTIGNLTLTAYNGQLSNDLFERKQQIFKDSHLELNRALAESTSWGRKEILARADELAERIISIWTGPIPGAKGAPVAGFDWSRIDAAVDAIPDGHWTTYAELAQLGATSPQPVGNRMASASGVPHAYRVLNRQGRVSADFRWSDPNDTRDVRAVLEGEGLRFTNADLADPAQFLTAYDLALLIPYEFDPDELERLRVLDEAVRQEQQDGAAWLKDGRAWHLNHWCSPKTRPILTRLVERIAEAAPETAPRWSQKYYVAWPLAGRNWLTVNPKGAWVWLRIPNPPCSSEEAAARLGFKYLPPGGSVSTATTGPSQVPSYEADGSLWIMIRNAADLEGAAGDALVDILSTARDHFAHSRGGADGGPEPPWQTNGYEWHLQRRCSAKTRAIVEALVPLISDAVPGAAGPQWNYKHYVSWDLNGRRWVSLKTWSAWIWLLLHATNVAAEDVARRLHATFIPANGTPSWATEGDVQVQVSDHVRGVRIMLRHKSDVDGTSASALRSILIDSATSRSGGADTLLDDGDEEEEPAIGGVGEV